jgi:methionyl-tRNA formyltransferase
LDIDHGDIVAQMTVTRPDGMTGCDLERQCAEEGGALLVDAINALDRDGELPGQPQQTDGASYFSFPTTADMIINPDWSARRAFNFICGADQWPLWVEAGATRYRIRAAKSYATDHQLDQPYVLLVDELWVQMKPGVLRLKIWPG